MNRDDFTFFLWEPYKKNKLLAVLPRWTCTAWLWPSGGWRSWLRRHSCSCRWGQPAASCRNTRKWKPTMPQTMRSGHGGCKHFWDIPALWLQPDQNVTQRLASVQCPFRIVVRMWEFRVFGFLQEKSPMHSPTHFNNLIISHDLLKPMNVWQFTAIHCTCLQRSSV